MDWRRLQEHLAKLGRADTDGVRIRARYGRCPACGREVLTGLDADVAGLPVTLDVVDLDPVAEAVVLLSGRRTYRILELPDGLRIARRDPWSIRGARQLRPVVADHRCGWPTPPSSAFRWKLPDPVAAGDVPPY